MMEMRVMCVSGCRVCVRTCVGTPAVLKARAPHL